MGYNRSEDPGLAQHDVRAEAARRADATPAVERAAAAGDNLDTLTKDQLLQEVERREQEQGADLGVKSNATKDEILAALRG